MGQISFQVGKGSDLTKETIFHKIVQINQVTYDFNIHRFLDSDQATRQSTLSYMMLDN